MRQENICLHLDNKYPIIFGEIETSYFNIEISIILHEIKMYLITYHREFNVEAIYKSEDRISNNGSTLDLCPPIKRKKEKVI